MDETNLEDIEINTICRTCLSTNRSIKQIFEVEKVEAVKFVTILKECTSIQISIDDDLPKGLCQTCIDQVFNYYEFKRQSLLSEKKLLNIFKNNIAYKNEELSNYSAEKVEVKNEMHDDDDNSTGEFVTYEDYYYLNGVAVSVKTLKTDDEILENDLEEGNEEVGDPDFELKCDKCDATFGSISSLTKHRRSDHKEKKHKCQTCGKSFMTAGVLFNHELSHGFNCTSCFRKFDTSEELETHAKEHKNPNYFACRECGKEFKKKSSLQLHLKIHTGEKPHLCTFCGRAFACQTNLNTHLRIHNGIRPYSCQHCNKEFAQWSSWKSHLITHNRERVHECPKCGKSFYRRGTLRTHMVTHSDLRKYSCTWCPKQFKTSSEVKRHLNIHTGEKMFTCTFCGKSFNRQSTLTVHNRIHTDERRFVCEVCNRGFIQRHVLIQHMKTHKVNNDNNDT
ncbi:zinc finger protein 664-like [Chrysoperla carnea]|uniref:zinc finger protein 664-like n=1 Tax=Chrysoperla carnea TaxID=189513 RepID=UPI001D06F9C8|nr:zinc finger protein 664-like [Chrysoperla carnea]